MSFSAVSTMGASTANSFTITPSGTGDFILLGVLSGFVAGSTTSYATALSATNISWSVLVAHTAFSANAGVETIFIGQVTAASSASTTITFNTGSPVCRTAWQEFSNTAGFSAVTLDGSAATTDTSSSGSFPSATPTRAGDLYWGYLWDNGTGTAGSTSGFTYQIDPNGNPTAYNVNCANSNQHPNIGDTADGTSGIAVLLYESLTTNAVFPSPQQGSRLYRQRSYRSQVLVLGPQVVNALAGLATGTGAALAPGIGDQAGPVTSTGAASAPGVELTPALATGAGSPLDGSEGTSVALTAGRAAGTGTALSPQPSLGTSAAVATATGTALTVPLSFAASVAPPQPGSSQYRRFWYRRQNSPLAPPPPVSPPLIVSGFGTFSQVPAGSVILAVIANISTFGSDVQVNGSSYELWDGTSAVIGTAQGTASLSSSWVDSVVFTGVTYSQLATLQLRIYARSMSGNHGATVSVDAVSLSVEWLPHQDVNIAPAVVTARTAFPRASLSTGETVTPGVLAVVPVFPAASAGLLNASVFPGVLATKAVFPKPAVSVGVNLSPAVLAVVPGLPAVPDVTYPGWASAEVDGGWSNPGNVTGTPDGSYATWVVP